jgi:hypothetical protein
MRFAPGALLSGGGYGQLGVLAGRRLDGSGLRQLAIELLPSLIAGAVDPTCSLSGVIAEVVEAKRALETARWPSCLAGRVWRG